MKNTIILTDLDGTLTRKSLVLEHAGFLIKHGIMTDNGIYKAWQEDMKNEHLIVALAEEYRHQITGKTEKELMCYEFVEEFLDNEENWYNTLEMVTDAQNFGATVVLITGSAEFLVRILAEKLNFDYFATLYHKNKDNTLNGEITGMFSDSHKSEVIENYIDLHLYDDVIGMGDTASDYGIFKHCNYNYLVEPTAQTMENLLLKNCKIDRIIRK